MKAKRLALRLFQTDVARTIGVHRSAIKIWERNLGEPDVSQLPGVIRFLGYVPFEQDGTRGGKVRWLRRCAGLSKKALSDAIGCEEGTIRRCEGNQPCAQGRLFQSVDALRRRLDTLGMSALTHSVVTELLSSAS